MQVFAENKQLGSSSPLLLIIGGNPLKAFEWLFSLHRVKRKPLFLKNLNES